ncbi:MAG: hypothetical protein ACAI44_27740 [Candidatus Sericytochromatia bacterium]
MKLMSNIRKTGSWRQLLSAAGLMLVLSSCGNPVITQNPPNDNDDSDGVVMVENRVFTEAEARQGIRCYQNSRFENARQAGNGFEATFITALSFKNRGLNIQYETTLQALIQSMLLYDRTSPIDCMN